MPTARSCWCSRASRCQTGDGCFDLSRPRWNVQPTLHRRARQPAFEPGTDRFELAEFDQIAGAVETDEIAHPAEHGDVGDGVVIIHEPLPTSQMRFHHAEQALGFSDVAIAGPLVLEILAGELVEEADLAE